MRDHPIFLEVEVHDVAVRTGGWCEECALPSVVEIDYAIVFVRSLAVYQRGTFVFCDECDRGYRRRR